MANNYPYLCIGTYILLCLQAKKEVKRQTVNGGKKATGYSDTDFFISFIDLLTEQHGTISSTLKNQTIYCQRPCADAVPFDRRKDEAKKYIDAFDFDIKNNYKKLLIKMDSLIKYYFDIENNDKILKLVCALKETIEKDNEIRSTDEFYIYGDGTSTTKDRLVAKNDFELQPFLLGIFHYILLNKPDNMAGSETIEKWTEKSDPNKPNSVTLFKSRIGQSYLKQTKYEIININTQNSIDDLEEENNNLNSDISQECDRKVKLDDDVADEEEQKRKDEYFKRMGDVLLPLAKVMDYYSKPWNWNTNSPENSKSTLENYINNQLNLFSKVRLPIVNKEYVDFYDLFVCNFYSRIQENYTKTEPFVVETNELKHDLEEDFLLSEKSFLFLGAGGVGKSTFIHNLYLMSLRYYDTYSAIPIHLYARRYKENDIKNKIAEINNFNTDSKYKVFFFIDALDEMKTSSLDSILNEIEECLNNKMAYFFVSSRPSDNINYIKKYLTTVYIYNFNNEDVYKYITNVCKVNEEENYLLNDKYNLKNFINNNKNFACIPLYLVLIIQILQKRGSLPNSRAEIFEEAYDLIFKKHDINDKHFYDRNITSGLSQDTIHNLLCGIGRYLFIEYQYDFDYDRFKNFIEKTVTDYNITEKFDKKDLLSDLVTAVPLLESYDSQEGTRYNFIYTTMCEYFAAYYYYQHTNEFFIDANGFLSGYEVYNESCSVIPLLFEIYTKNNPFNNIEEKYIYPLLRIVLNRYNNLETYIMGCYGVIYTSEENKAIQYINRPEFYLVDFILQYFGQVPPILDYFDIDDYSNLIEFKLDFSDRKKPEILQKNENETDEEWIERESIEHEKWLEEQADKYYNTYEFPAVWQFDFQRICTNKTKYQEAYNAIMSPDGCFSKEFDFLNNKLNEYINKYG